MYINQHTLEKKYEHIFHEKANLFQKNCGYKEVFDIIMLLIALATIAEDWAEKQ